MTNKQTSPSLDGLEAVAELLLWAGWDEAADRIYAMVFGADAAECQMPADLTGQATSA